MGRRRSNWRWLVTGLIVAGALTAAVAPAHAGSAMLGRVCVRDLKALIDKVGAGRPRLDQAVNAGLYFNETRSGFVNANPRNGGDPKNLNLPGLTDTACRNSCTFDRRVTDLAGGAIYHCGPVVVKEKGRWVVKAAGPTTSIREEPYQADVIGRYGLRGVIGKGGMGAKTLAGLAEHGAVYLHAIGGAASLIV